MINRHKVQFYKIFVIVTMTCLIGTFIKPACAAPPYRIWVSLAYLNNTAIITGPPALLPPGNIDPNLFRRGLLSRRAFPNPFDPDPSGNTRLIASGPSNTPHDTGVIMFENDGELPVDIHINELIVRMENCEFAPWADRPEKVVTLGNGQRLVLAETVAGAPFCTPSSFDTSEAARGFVPRISGRISTGYTEDIPIEIDDVELVLFGRGGRDLGGAQESTNYHVVRPPLSAALPEGPLLLPPENNGCSSWTLKNIGNVAAAYMIRGAQYLLCIGAINCEDPMVPTTPFALGNQDGTVPAGGEKMFNFEQATNGTPIRSATPRDGVEFTLIYASKGVEQNIPVGKMCGP